MMITMIVTMMTLVMIVIMMMTLMIVMITMNCKGLSVLHFNSSVFSFVICDIFFRNSNQCCTASDTGNLEPSPHYRCLWRRPI